MRPAAWEAGPAAVSCSWDSPARQAPGGPSIEESAGSSPARSATWRRSGRPRRAGPSRWKRSRSGTSRPALLPAPGAHVDDGGRADPLLATPVDRGAPAPHDPAHDREAQARAGRARAELGLEDPGQDVLRDARALVHDLDADRVRIATARAHLDGRALGAGGAGVLEEVHEHLPELRLPGDHGRQVRR